MSKSNNDRGVTCQKTADSVMLYYKGRPKLFASDTPEYNKVVEILKVVDCDDRKAQLFEFWTSLQNKPVSKDVNAEFTVNEVNGEVSINGKVLEPVLGERLRQHKAEGLPYLPILKFAERLNNNPSYMSKQRLFGCLEVNHHPLLDDGRFLCWRKVRRNSEGKLVDIRTGKVDNSVGATPRMDRNEVEDNPNVTCGRGYHASSFDYAKNHYGNSNDVMVEVAVSPEDVVSVPFDYNSQKIRICSYEVLAEVEVENTALLADHKPTHSFASNPDEDVTCIDCRNHYDFCECNDDICEDCDFEPDKCSSVEELQRYKSPEFIKLYPTIHFGGFMKKARANKVLKLALASPMANYIDFQLEKYKNYDWYGNQHINYSLIGYIKGAKEMFEASPEGFYL